MIKAVRSAVNYLVPFVHGIVDNGPLAANQTGTLIAGSVTGDIAAAAPAPMFGLDNMSELGSIEMACPGAEDLGALQLSGALEVTT